MVAKYILVFLFFLVLSAGIAWVVLRLLHSANFKEKNFLEKNIITSAGLIFLIFQLFYAGYLFIFEMSLALKGWPVSLLIIGFGMGILGFIDDLFGDHEVSGFGGHFGALFSGQVTTGLIKAIIGFGLSFIVAYLASNGVIDIIVNSLIIGLSINLFNLLDLRPGRSLKVFLVSNVVIFSFSKAKGLWLASIPVYGPVLVLAYLDLQLFSMLGDTGSNFLGSMIGVWVVYSFPLKINLAILLGLIIIHLYSEKHSISKFISENRVLRWLDNIGLKREM